MALPTTQTAAKIKSAALSLTGDDNPGGGLLSKADVWLRLCLNQFYKLKDFKIIESEHIRRLKAYVQDYALPSDFDKVLDVRIFYGTFSGTATAGSANSLTLAADEDIEEARAKDKLIYLTSGTNANQRARITDYNATTKVAATTIWETTPAGDESYVIIESDRYLSPQPRENISDIVTQNIPVFYYLYNDRIYFDNVVDDSTDQVWHMRYLIDLHYLDLTDSRMTTIYNELQEELIQGVYAYALLNNDDSDAKAASEKFYWMLREYKKKDSRERRMRSHLQIKSSGGMPV